MAVVVQRFPRNVGDSRALTRAKHSYNAGRMDFLQLLDGAEYLAQQGNPQIAGLDYDSRRVQPGWCFVAIHGETTDGKGYIDAALGLSLIHISEPTRLGMIS